MAEQVQQLDPNTQVNVNLALGHVDQILNALADKPYKEVAEVVYVIRFQVEQQLAAMKAKDAERTVDAPATEVEDKAETGRVA